MKWYLEVLKKYAVFQGRARRKEYWYFSLFNLIFILLLTWIDALSNSNPNDVGPLPLIYLLAMLIPSLAVTVRRLHDINKSGWWILLYFIPVLGDIVLFIFTVLKGTPGDNRYGPDPLMAPAVAEAAA